MGKSPRRFRSSPQRRRSGALRLLAASASPSPLASSLAANRVPRALCGICAAPAVRGAYEYVGHQFYSTSKAPFPLLHLPQPGFQPRPRGGHRCAGLPVGRSSNDPPARLIGPPRISSIAAAPIHRRCSQCGRCRSQSRGATGEIIIDSKTWPCAVTVSSATSIMAPRPRVSIIPNASPPSV